MLRRRPLGMRLFVAGLILASLGLQVPPPAAARVAPGPTGLVSSVPLRDTLALPAQRADEIPIASRERLSLPLVVVASVATRGHLGRGTGAFTPVQPRARSHPARLRARTATDDPPLH